jgi:ketosteroid isomerase-like protein
MRQALGDRLDPDARTFLDLMAPDFTMEFPYARPGMARRIEGLDPVLEYLATVGQGIAVDHFSDVAIHQTDDPDVVIVEFTSHGQALRTGEPYENRYISVIRTRGGQIVHYTDYWNPLAGLKARIGSAAVESFAWNGPPEQRPPAPSPDDGARS